MDSPPGRAGPGRGEARRGPQPAEGKAPPLSQQRPGAPPLPPFWACAAGEGPRRGRRGEGRGGGGGTAARPPPGSWGGGEGERRSEADGGGRRRGGQAAAFWVQGRAGARSAAATEVSGRGGGSRLCLCLGIPGSLRCLPVSLLPDRDEGWLVPNPVGIAPSGHPPCHLRHPSSSILSWSGSGRHRFLQITYQAFLHRQPKFHTSLWSAFFTAIPTVSRGLSQKLSVLNPQPYF